MFLGKANFVFILDLFLFAMGSVFSKCLYGSRKYLIFVGLSGTGKTAIINSLQGKRDGKSKLAASAKTHIFEETTVRTQGYTLNIFDVEGKSQLSQFWKYYTWNSDLIVFVVDMSSQDSILESRDPFEAFVNSNVANGRKVIFLLNKADFFGGDREQIRLAVDFFKKTFSSVDNFVLNHEKIYPCSSVDGKSIMKIIKDNLKNSSE